MLGLAHLPVPVEMGFQEEDGHEQIKGCPMVVPFLDTTDLGGNASGIMWHLGIYFLKPLHIFGKTCLEPPGNQKFMDVSDLSTVPTTCYAKDLQQT